MKMTNSKVPRNRREFERNFFLVAEMMQQGKLHFMAQAIQGLDRLQQVKSLPNGRIDLLTINEGARNLANSMANFTNMPKITEMMKNQSEEN